MREKRINAPLNKRIGRRIFDLVAFFPNRVVLVDSDIGENHAAARYRNLRRRIVEYVENRQNGDDGGQRFERGSHSTVTFARRFATPAVYRESATLNATASSIQSCQTPSGSCDAAVMV